MSAEGSIAANVALFRPFIKATVDKMVRTLFADDDDDNEPNPTLGVLTGAEQVLTMLLLNKLLELSVCKPLIPPTRRASRFSRGAECPPRRYIYAFRRRRRWETKSIRTAAFFVQKL
jgi:hypothetical protein